MERKLFNGATTDEKGILTLQGAAYAQLLPDEPLSVEMGTLSIWVKPFAARVSDKYPTTRTLAVIRWLPNDYFVLSQGWWEHTPNKDNLVCVMSDKAGLIRAARNELIPEIWTHIVVTWLMIEDDYWLNVYINGKPFGRTVPFVLDDSANAFVAASDQPVLWLGTDQAALGPDGRTLDAQLKVETFSRTLDQAEVFALYDRGKKELEVTGREWMAQVIAQPPYWRSFEGQQLETRIMFDESAQWVDRSKALRILDYLAEANFNAYAPCVWHGGGARWSSPLVEPEPAIVGILQTANPDALGVLIEEGAKRGIEIHFWVCLALREWDRLKAFYPPGTPTTPHLAYNMLLPAFRDFLLRLLKDLIQYGTGGKGIICDYARTMGIVKNIEAIAAFERYYQDQDWYSCYAMRDVVSAGRAALETQYDDTMDQFMAEVQRLMRLWGEDKVLGVCDHPVPREVSAAGLRELQGRNGLAWVNDDLIDCLYAMDYTLVPDVATMDLVRRQLREGAGRALTPLFGIYDRAGVDVYPRDSDWVVDSVEYRRRAFPGAPIAFYLLGNIDNPWLSRATVDKLKAGPFSAKARARWRYA